MSQKRFFKTPGKKETLAKKQEARLRRVNRLRGRLPGLLPRWWVGVGEVLGVTVLLGLNLFLLIGFFGQPDQTNAFSAPILPVLAGLTEVFVPYAYSLRLWLLAFFIFFPLVFYFFVKEVTGRKLAGFLAAFTASLPINPFLNPRVKMGLLSEDGGSIASLTLAPIVCLFLRRFLRRGHFWTGIASAFGSTLVALTSPIGFLVLIVFAVVITFSEILLGYGRLKAIRFFLVVVFAAGFASFWYNPKFTFLILNSSKQGQLIKNTFTNLLPISFFIGPVLGVFGFLLFENKPGLQSLFIALFLTIAFGLFSLGAGVAHPVPSRFLPAFGISLAFLLAVLLVGLFDFWRPNQRPLAASLILAAVVGLVIFSFLFRNNLYWSVNQQVLGAAAVTHVGVWGIKEGVSLAENLLGYAITTLTALGVVFLKKRI